MSVYKFVLIFNRVTNATLRLKEELSRIMLGQVQSGSIRFDFVIRQNNNIQANLNIVYKIYESI